MQSNFQLNQNHQPLIHLTKVLSSLVSLILITNTLVIFAMQCNSSIFGKRLFIFMQIKHIPPFLKTFHSFQLTFSLRLFRLQKKPSLGKIQSQNGSIYVKQILILSSMQWPQIKIYISREYKQNFFEKTCTFLIESLIKQRKTIFLTIQFSQLIPQTQRFHCKLIFSYKVALDL